MSLEPSSWGETIVLVGIMMAIAWVVSVVGDLINRWRRNKAFQKDMEKAAKAPWRRRDDAR